MIFALAALFLLAGCAFPISDEEALKAIKAESLELMAKAPPENASALPEDQGTNASFDLPKNRWPRAIAGLKPAFVVVRSDSVYLMTKPDFDGGWGYYVPRNEQEHPQPEGRYTKLKHGVYWFHPY